MSTLRIEDLLHYVAFSDRDRFALVNLHRLVQPHLKGIIDCFYRAIEADPEARAVLADEAQVERLKLSLLGWIDRVLTGPWDATYAALRERIGHVHVRVGLPQRYMLTSMSVIRVELHRAVDELVEERREAALAHQALGRILDVDLAIMLETYREDSMDAIRRVEKIERKILTDELNVSEERYRAVLESAEVVAIAVARDDSVRLFNRQAEHASGRGRTEVLELADLDEIWHPADRARLRSALEKTRKRTTSHVLEARLVTKKQQVRFVRWHIGALPPADSGDVCFIGIDLTAERELGERTRRAEELATLGTLAAGLAHEIRNPLNAAQLQLTLAERRLARLSAGPATNTEEVAEPIAVVRTELHRLTALVADFLAYARPAPLRLRAVDLRSAVRAIVELMKPVAETAEVELMVRGDESVTAQCDEEQCRQVLLNLVKNSIEAASGSSGGGRGVVEVSVRREGPSSYIQVTDNGPGLPDSVNIFEPFATSKEGGMGLGLSIVKRIIDQHGGRVSTRRAAERTVFEVELPTAGPSP